MAMVSRPHSGVQNVPTWTVAELKVVALQVVLHLGLLSHINRFRNWDLRQKLVVVLSYVNSLSL